MLNPLRQGPATGAEQLRNPDPLALVSAAAWAEAELRQSRT